jgi:hypothetical protein
MRAAPDDAPFRSSLRMICIAPSLHPLMAAVETIPHQYSHEDIDGPSKAEVFNLLGQCPNVRKLQSALPREVFRKISRSFRVVRPP